MWPKLFQADAGAVEIRAQPEMTKREYLIENSSLPVWNFRRDVSVKINLGAYY
jgi:hypothetical protein